MTRVLLIEDEELIGTMVRLNLEACGVAVDWVRDGEEGLAKALAEDADLILLDIAMPRRSGLEILRELRHQGVGTRVMMLTARGDVPSKVQALDLGADDYLPKPFDVSEMIARVQALLRRARAER